MNIITAKLILTSKETYDPEYPTVSIDNALDAMIEFAKLHVEIALKEANDKSRLEKASNYGTFDEFTAEWNHTSDKLFVKPEYGHGDSGYNAVRINKDSILNAYPLTLIK